MTHRAQRLPTGLLSRIKSGCAAVACLVKSHLRRQCRRPSSLPAIVLGAPRGLEVPEIFAAVMFTIARLKRAPPNLEAPPSQCLRSLPRSCSQSLVWKELLPTWRRLHRNKNDPATPKGWLKPYKQLEKNTYQLSVGAGFRNHPLSQKKSSAHQCKKIRVIETNSDRNTYRFV